MLVKKIAWARIKTEVYVEKLQNIMNMQVLIPFPWTLLEEPIREWASYNKINLRHLGIRTRGNIFFSINLMLVRIKWLHTLNNVDMVQVSKTEKYNKLTDCLIGIYWAYKDITLTIAGWEGKRMIKRSLADFIIAHRRKQQSIPRKGKGLINKGVSTKGNN